MKPLLSIIMLSTLLVGAPALSPAQADPDRTVVTVNGTEVKAAAYYRRMEYLPGVAKKVGNNLLDMPPGLITIDQMITDILVLQLAKEKGVFPSDLEINQELGFRKADNPDLMSIWKESGRTEDELKEQIKVELAQFKISTFGITVTDQDVDKYYKTYADRLTIPRQYKLSVIAVSVEADKATVDADLTAGKPFPEVAKARSVDVTRLQNGEYGTVPETALTEATRTALTGTKIGATTPWITTNANGSPIFVKFRVDDIVASSKDPLTPSLRRRIRRQRMLDLGRVQNDISKDMINFRKKAKIDIKQPEWASAYQKFIEQYLNTPGVVGAGGG